MGLDRTLRASAELIRLLHPHNLAISDAAAYPNHNGLSSSQADYPSLSTLLLLGTAINRVPHRSFEKWVVVLRVI
jgi:hypothetical protein